jgi:hypothetical protein
LQDITCLCNPATRIPYYRPDGTEEVRFRIALTGKDRFRWRNKSKPCLYGLWKLDEARKAGKVVLLEGESDCHTCWFHDIPAIGVPGAANWREERDAPQLEGIPDVYVVLEPDQGGEAVQRWLASSAIRDRVRLVTLGEYKDVSDLYLADPEHFKERLESALELSVSWEEHDRKRSNEQHSEAWERCKSLALASDILGEFAKDLEARGLVGETRAAKLLYLCITSRLLERPTSAAVKGPSSAGKSHLVEQVLEFFPTSTYYALSAMSEKALAYSEEPLAHRFLVLYEAAGMNGDFASYLIRSLLSEGRVRYETVEKTHEGLRPRLIEREGPTGLLVTTTAVKLHPENETRLLEIPVDDTPEQTSRVLVALAEEGTGAVVNIDCWHALQDWLGLGPSRVSIPYAKRLAELIPPLAVRLRRDFAAILNLVRAHALLHQANRERDSEEHIVATLDDYAVVKGLVADLVADRIEGTVSPTIRQTVVGVQSLNATSSATPPEGVTVAALAKLLKLDKSATLRRVRVAQERGYVRNLENGKGRAARLVVGDPLPEDQQVMPEVEALQGCTVAGNSGGIAPPSPGHWEADL